MYSGLNGVLWVIWLGHDDVYKKGMLPLSSVEFFAILESHTGLGILADNMAAENMAGTSRNLPDEGTIVTQAEGVMTTSHSEHH